ncbi:hypothetical protein DACRYDRAFT_103927 [Dacryopinax primogenitus]|uniref:Uncharacterized protein n=1 Tax=Dacryopinax primogenitus (strain DJM 731) TaxID=1858805 RepID=M5GGG4_DACPD|nr:uncharacterized protein DACRYDRAFT_103927 [Dacryopinax primogenitus]EJU05443.1 hypothetical protein DACRYDRAFT_103927 [Dacryopinax primogenitus]
MPSNKKQWAERKLTRETNRLRHAKASELLDVAEQAWLQTLDEISLDTGIPKNVLNANMKGQKAGYFDSKRRVSLFNAAKHLLAQEARSKGEIFYWALPENKNIIEAKVEWLRTHPEAALSAEHAILAKRESKHLQKDLSALELVAMLVACGFVVRGNIKDYAKPHFFGDELCKQFFEEIIGYPVLQIAMGLEAYCTSGGAQGKCLGQALLWRKLMNE